MSILSRLRAAARYNVLTPVMLLSLGIASPTMAANADHVITSPETDYVLDINDALTNRSTITGATLPAIYSIHDIRFIRNDAGAEIVSNNNLAIYVGGDLDELTNAGVISGYNNGITIGGNVIDFTNTETGTIYGGDDGVEIVGTVRNFDNRGDISGHGDGVVIHKRVENFTNRNTITGEDGDGVDLLGGVGGFNNSGTIDGEGTGVYITGGATSFVNDGTISGGLAGVHIVGGVKNFENRDSIIGEIGVAIFGEVKNFNNSGEILASQNGVIFHNDAGTVRNSNVIGVLAPTGGFDGLRFGHSVQAISNSGGIFGPRNAIRVTDGLGELVNDGDGMIISRDVAVYVGGNADRIVNHGGIASVDAHGIEVIGELQTFVNSGTMESGANGLYVHQRAGTITNSGVITSTDGLAIRLDAAVESVVNSGTLDADESGIYVGGYAGRIVNSGLIITDQAGINARSGATEIINTDTIASVGYGVFVNGDITNFANSKDIVSSNDTSVYLNGDVTHFNNSGLISGDEIGVRVAGRAGDFNNSGTIQGIYGVQFDQGGAYFKNSGLIESSDNDFAVVFNGDDNKLALGTGARFVGEVDFGGGANTQLDISGYNGSTILYVTQDSLQAGNVIAGNNYYSQLPFAVAIVGGGFVNQASQPVINLASGLEDLITGKLALGMANSDDTVMSYAAQPKSEAEAATLAAMSGTGGATYWADAIGGVGRNAGAESADVYGALIAGAHTQVATNLALGVLGGFGQTHLDIGNGSQTIKSTVGIVGAYGSYDMGSLRSDFSLIGGLSGNDGTREFTFGNQTETAQSSYGGWFIAPTVGVSMPMLSTETGEVSIGAKVGYLGGGFSGYTETGSVSNLIVDAQTYGVLTALAEVRGENAVSDTVTINGSLGVFVQNRHGNAVDLTFAASNLTLIGPDSVGGTSVGVKAGIGADAVISDALNLNAGVTGNWRSSGTIAASANLGIGGKF